MLGAIVVRRLIIFSIETILWKTYISIAECLRYVYILQNDFKIRAALSLSLSRDVGQKASDPILFVSLLTG